MAERHLTVGPGQVKGAVSHAGTLVLLHQRQRRLAVLCHSEDEVKDRGLVWGQRDRAPQGDDGIEDGADGVGQRRDAFQRGGIREGSTASHKSGAIGLAGNCAQLTPLTHHQMQQPRRFLLLRAGAAGAENGGGLSREFRLDKQVAECGMRRVRVGLREHHFGVTGQFNDACHGGTVRDRDAP